MKYLALVLLTACELQDAQTAKLGARNDVVDVCPADLTDLPNCTYYTNVYSSQNQTELFCDSATDTDKAVERAITDKFGTYLNEAGSYQARIMVNETSIFDGDKDIEYKGLFFTLMDSRIDWSNSCAE